MSRVITIFCGSARRGRTTETVTVEPGSPSKNAVNFGERHLVRALALDRLEDVGILNTRFFGGAAGNDRDHIRVSEALGDGWRRYRLCPRA